MLLKGFNRVLSGTRRPKTGISSYPTQSLASFLPAKNNSAAAIK